MVAAALHLWRQSHRSTTDMEAKYAAAEASVFVETSPGTARKGQGGGGPGDSSAAPAAGEAAESPADNDSLHEEELLLSTADGRLILSALCPGVSMLQAFPGAAEATQVGAPNSRTGQAHHRSSAADDAVQLLSLGMHKVQPPPLPLLARSMSAVAASSSSGGGPQHNGHISHGKSEDAAAQAAAAVPLPVHKDVPEVEEGDAHGRPSDAREAKAGSPSAAQDDVSVQLLPKVSRVPERTSLG